MEGAQTDDFQRVAMFNVMSDKHNAEHDGCVAYIEGDNCRVREAWRGWIRMLSSTRNESAATVCETQVIDRTVVPC